MARKKARLSEAEREERRRADRERLEEAARELQSSGGWQRWVALRRHNGLARYSFGNQLLIALEAWRRGFEPRYVAGYRWWGEHGYQVRGGERGLRILAPLRRKLEDEQGEDAVVVVGFRAVSVFDRSQVDAGPRAERLAPESQSIEGDSHAAHIEPLAAFLRERGLTVEFRQVDRGGASGYFNAKRSEIVVEAGKSANARLRTLLHEGAHALAHQLRSDEDAPVLSYAEEEVVVETAGHVAAAGLGLDTSREAVPYVAGWGEDGRLEAVRRAAEQVDRLARELEQAAMLAEEPEAIPAL